MVLVLVAILWWKIVGCLICLSAKNKSLVTIFARKALVKPLISSIFAAAKRVFAIV